MGGEAEPLGQRVVRGGESDGESSPACTCPPPRALMLQVGKALTEGWYREQLESHGRPMVRETMGGGGLVPRAARVTRQANGA